MRAMIIAAALAFAAAPAVHAQGQAQRQIPGQTPGQTGNASQGRAPSPDREAQCAGPDGKEATNAQCKGAGPAPAASLIYKKDAKGQCRDADGKAVTPDKCEAPS